MAINAKDVMALRQRTGLGMMDCKAALAETDGDTDAAIELLRKKLKGQMDDRADRASGEGLIAVAQSADALAMLELNCETDFVARTDQFIEVGQKLAELALQAGDGDITPDDAMSKLVDDLRISTRENVQYCRGAKISGATLGHYVHHNRKVGVVLTAEGELDADLLTGLCQHVAAHVPTPMAVDEAGLDPQLVEKQKADAIAEAEATGKPAQIAEKIATGKLKKWVDEHTLLGQKYVKDPAGKQTVKSVVPSTATVTTFTRYAVGA